MRIVPVARALALAGVVLVVSASGTSEDPGPMACGDWLVLSSDQRLALTSQVIGSADQVVARIRAVAARGGVDVGTRATLVAWVEGSLTKNCEIWPPRTRSVRATFDALYP